MDIYNKQKIIEINYDDLKPILVSNQLNTDLKFKTIGSKYYKNMNIDEDKSYLKQYNHLISIDYGKKSDWSLILCKINNIKRNIYINPE